MVQLNEYQQAKPFPHVVIEDFYDKEVLSEAVKDFPDLREVGFYSVSPFEDKYISNLRQGIPDKLMEILENLTSPVFISWIENLTGIKGLLSDKTFEGGGLHETYNGGFLKMHSDFPYKGIWHRRINLLLYLNKDWKYGGDVELWNEEMTNMEVKVSPQFNTCVIFSTNPTSWHGQPDKIKCPKDVSRKSIALYYYSLERPQEEIEDKRNSLWAARMKNGKIDLRDKTAFGKTPFVKT